MEENKRELTLVRTFDAPRKLVFKAWIDPELVVQWWGPQGVTNTAKSWEARPGGKIDLVMLAGEALGPLKGQEWPMSGEFKEVEPSKLVFTGNALVDGKEVMTLLTTVTLEEEDGKTKMTVHIVVTKITQEAAGPLAGMEIGWNQQLDKLGEFLARY